MQRIEIYDRDLIKVIVEYVPNNVLVRNFLPKYFWRFFDQDIISDIRSVRK